MYNSINIYSWQSKIAIIIVIIDKNGAIIINY